MGDSENSLPPSKKRAAGIQLSKDNPGLDDEEGGPELETGTFKKASEEVLAKRRIVKVRRHQTSSAPSAPPSNPFAGICLVPPTNSNATEDKVTTVEEGGKTVPDKVEEKTNSSEEIVKGKVEPEKSSESKIDEGSSAVEKEKENDTINESTKPETASAKGGRTENEVKEDTENGDKKDNGNENVQESAEGASFSSFQQLSSSQNAFTGFAGTGFSSSTFSFGSIPKDGSFLGSNSGSLFGLKNDQPSFPSFGSVLSNSGNSSLFGTPGASTVNKSEGSGIPAMQEVPVETGEENEKAVFTADSVLFEFFDGGWKERGKGELKVNVPTTGTGKGRLVMRAKGNYRLILNASLYSDMKLTSMEKRGITFACVNSASEGKDGLSTFALKFKDASIVDEFRGAVTEHKGHTAGAVKTPENSPKASDE
ncbi:hypothetical protein LguiA_009914 [Lonicera macranthoides]